MQQMSDWGKGMGEQEKQGLKRIRTKDLADGMMFTSTVYIDKKNIFVSANVPIKKKDIERLLNWGILELETAGEIVPETIPVQKTSPQDSPHRVEAVARMEAELKKLVEEQLRNRKTPLPLKEPTEKQAPGRDLGARVTLAEYHTSWIEDCEKQITSARNNVRLDRGEAGRVVKEILQLAERDSQGLLGQITHRQKGEYLAVHGTNVAVYSAIIGMRMGIEREALTNLVMGCYFLDIGMVRVPDEITQKEGRLEIEELKKIHAHPVYGYQILVQQNGFPIEVGMVALEHHEKINGVGYPRKLSGRAITLFGRLAAILDTYEAMTGHRTYRDEYISHEAMKNLIASGQTLFDNDLLATFLREVGVYPVGSRVLLNNNAVGVVIATDPALPMRPELQIVRDEFGDPVLHREVVRLAQERDLVIMQAIDEKDIRNG